MRFEKNKVLKSLKFFLLQLGILLEQHVLLNRKNEVNDEHYVNYHEIVKNSAIYICTTMYHEADYEMEQLLQSLSKVDMARKESGRQFEAHIFFDDGARGNLDVESFQPTTIFLASIHFPYFS